MLPKNSLTVVVLTHNDESRIIDCLECLGFADELIIVDDASSDRTVDLARSFTDKIYKRDLSGNFSNQRNFALNNAHNPWVLFIDSDEFISERLKNEILSKIQSKSVIGYFLNRVDVMWGKKIIHGEAGEVKLLRLAKIGSGKWHGKVHEVWRVKGKTDELTQSLIHAPHQSVREFIADVDRYSSLRAKELGEAGARSNAFLIAAYPMGKFIVNYFIKKGYKDGIAGFIYAMTMSFHSFLVRGKLYLEKSNPN